MQNDDRWLKLISTEQLEKIQTLNPNIKKTRTEIKESNKAAFNCTERHNGDKTKRSPKSWPRKDHSCN